MGFNNVQRGFGYRDEYIYNVKTGKFYLRTPGDNYKEVTLPGSPDIPEGGGSGGDGSGGDGGDNSGGGGDGGSNSGGGGNPGLETPDFSGSYQQASQQVNLGADVSGDIPAGTVFDVMVFSGQSNMVGRGTWNLVGNWPKSGTSYTMNYDMSGTGVQETTNSFRSAIDTSDGCMQTAFARVYGEAAQRRTLLVPAAKGGSTIADYQPGGTYFTMLTNAIGNAKSLCDAKGWVINSFTVHWHQGENDQYDNGVAGDIPRYMNALDNVQLELEDQHPGVIDNWFIHRVGTIIAEPAQAGWNILRAQSTLCAQQPDTYKIAHLGLAAMTNTLHYSQAGYNQWGEESAAIVNNSINNNIEVNMWTEDPSLSDVWGEKPEVLVTIKPDGTLTTFGAASLPGLPTDFTTDEDGNIASALNYTFPPSTFGSSELATSSIWSVAIAYGNFAGYARVVSGISANDWLYIDTGVKFNSDEAGRTTNSMSSLSFPDEAGVLFIYGDGTNLCIENHSDSSLGGAVLNNSVTYSGVGAITLTKLLDQLGGGASVSGIAISSTGKFAPYFGHLLFAPSRVDSSSYTDIFYQFNNDFIDLSGGTGAPLSYKENPTPAVYATSGALVASGPDQQGDIDHLKNWNFKMSDEFTLGMEFSVADGYVFSETDEPQSHSIWMAELSSTEGASCMFYSNLFNAVHTIRFRVNGITADVDIRNILENDGAGTKFTWVAQWLPTESTFNFYLNGLLVKSTTPTWGTLSLRNFPKIGIKDAQIAQEIQTDYSKVRVVTGSTPDPTTFLD